MACWKAHVRISIRVNWTTSIFAIYHGSGVMRWNVYSSAVFTGIDLFALNFYLDRVVLHQPFLASETGGTELPGGKAASFCVPLLWHNTGVWQTDGYAAQRIYTPLAKLALPCTVIKIVSKSNRVNFNRNKNNTHWPSFVRIIISCN